MKLKKILSILLMLFVMFSLTVNLYANTYINNSIEIEVSPDKRSYDYGDNVAIIIGIKNKNRYGKLHYKITEIYSGGGFVPLNLNNDETIISEFENSEKKVQLRDKYYKESEDKIIDTHITFNNGYFNSKGKMSIGRHVYEITEKEFKEFEKYRHERISGRKLGSRDHESEEQLKLDTVKSKINATLLVIAIVLLMIIILVIYIFFIIKTKSIGRDYLKSIIALIGVSLIIVIVKDCIYAADIYQENVKYNKSVSTQVNYANFSCTFDVKIEYYFANVIDPITDLELDTDFDTLPDYLEVLYLTDLNNEDTDGDGLFDGVEVYRTYTDPLREDTDGDGINDGDEDFDGDNLNNIDEKNYGTDYENSDTDFDGLSDYDEVNGVKNKGGSYTYTTDPLNDDTDGDGLRDSTELKLNLNPTNPYDAKTKVEQRYDVSRIPRALGRDSSTPITFFGNLVGDIDEKVKVRISNNGYFDMLNGVIGNPILIDTEYGYDDGLKIEFELSKYETIKDRIQLCRYSDGDLMPVSNTYVTNNTLLGDVFSGEYVLVDAKKYINALKIYFK